MFTTTAFGYLALEVVVVWLGVLAYSIMRLTYLAGVSWGARQALELMVELEDRPIPSPAAQQPQTYQQTYQEHLDGAPMRPTYLPPQR